MSYVMNLFTDDVLSEKLSRGQKLVDTVVAEIDRDQFVISSDKELISHVEARLGLACLELHVDKAVQRDEEVLVDAKTTEHSILPELAIFGTVPGIKVTVSIPYTGYSWLFGFTPSCTWPRFPRGALIIGPNDTGHIEISVSRPADIDEEEFKTAYKKELQLLCSYTECLNTDIRNHNALISTLAAAAISQRKTRLQKHQSIVAILDIPIKAKASALPFQPVPIELRPLPSLPVAPKGGLKPEPGISDKLFEQILHVIRHGTRAFENTAKTFAKLEEEELRDVLLSHLNLSFMGRVGAEVFRKVGKTDLCIEEDSRSAFVAECKMWKGKRSVDDAFSQLLGYLTWRDSRAALVIINKSVGAFSTVTNQIPEIIRSHRLFIQQNDCDESGEWRFLVRSTNDEGRRLTLHVFAVDLYLDNSAA